MTVLVGKNESGKTALLKALHKFNPFTPEPYSMADEWPRGHRDKRSEDQVACTTEFELTGEEKQELSEITDQKVNIDKIQVTRDYAGNFEVHFPEKVFPDKLHPNDIDEICSSLPEIHDPVADDFQKTAQACRTEALRLAHEGRFTELAEFHTDLEKRLQAVRSPGGQDPQHQNEENYLNQVRTALGAAVKRLQESPSIREKAHDYVVSHLPTFVYMGEYKAFRGAALLDQVKERSDRKQLTEEDKTFLTILALSGLDLDEGVKAATQPDRTERQYDLSDAATTLTGKFASHWGAHHYEVQFRADGPQFFTFVKAPTDKGLIKLEERSHGFQWFFSFDLTLMHETQGTLKDCVILLDEPGLHLHPGAQRDLLTRLDEYAEGNTLIYTTHLPFMIDLQEPSRIRVLGETKKGTIVEEDLTKTQPEAKLTLQAALGISGRTSYLVAEHNLVVEGVHDYWYITELSNLLVRSGKPGLAEELLITPAGGASETTYIATFMIGQELDVIALYDTDTPGNTAKDKLVKKWLTRYQCAHATALSLGPAVGVEGREFGIEDLFPEDFYLKHVQECYKSQLSGAQIAKIELPRGEMLCKRVEQFFKEKRLPKFNKGSVAKRICADLRKMKSVDDLGPEIIQKAETLIKAINDALPKKD